MRDDKLVRYTVFYDNFKYFVRESSVLYDDVTRYLILLAAGNEHVLWNLSFFLFLAQKPPVGQNRVSLLSRSHDHTLFYTSHSVGLLWTSDTPTRQTLPDNTQHSQQTDIHASAVFEPTIPASERRQTHALVRAATGAGWDLYYGGENGQCKIQNYSAELYYEKCKFYVVVVTFLRLRLTVIHTSF